MNTNKVKTLAVPLAMVALVGTASAQEATPEAIDAAAYTSQLTDGLSTTFSSVMGVVIPIIVVVTGIGIFRKLRNKA